MSSLTTVRDRLYKYLNVRLNKNWEYRDFIKYYSTLSGQELVSENRAISIEFEVNLNIYSVLSSDITVDKLARLIYNKLN